MEPEKSILKEFLADGWIIVLLGTATMVARILVDKEKSNIRDALKKIVSAAILTTVIWSFIRDMPMADLHRALIYGVVGAISPEILQGVVKLGKAFAKNPFRFLKKGN